MFELSRSANARIVWKSSAGGRPGQPGPGQPVGEVVQVGLRDVDHEPVDVGVAQCLGHDDDATVLLGSNSS